MRAGPVRVRPSHAPATLSDQLFLAVVFFAVVAFLAVVVFAGVVFFAVVVFLAVVVFAAELDEVDLVAVVFLAAVVLAVDFFAGVVFFAVVVLAAVVFLAGADFAAVFLAVEDALAVDLAGADFVVVDFLAVDDARAALAAATLGSFFAPDTTAFRSAPGRNFGTAVFLARVRSPVRGLRTIRAGRTAFSKAPKPVIATFSPLATSRVMVSSTDSRACCAAFLLPSKWLDRASMS